MTRTALLIATTAVVAAFGCGGRESGTSASGSGADRESTSDSSGASSSASGNDGGPRNIVDAETPDAFSASCALFAFVIDAHAAANTCSFTPADVACNSNADCTFYVQVGCGCFAPVYGVNTANTVKCFPPPCTPMLNVDGGLYTCPSNASGLYTQACQFVRDSLSVAVACVDHQCLTLPAAPESE